MSLIMKVMPDRCHWPVVLWTVCFLAIIGFPNIAQAGFFDFLFGTPPPPQAIRPPYEAYHFRRHAAPGFVRHAEHGSHRHAPQFAAHRKVIVADKADHKVGPQAPVDLMDDDSLKHGDAVMTQNGIRVYMGYSSEHHQPGDFLKLSAIKKLSKRERSALAALDTPGANPDEPTAAGEASLAMGRSVTEQKLTVGETITDPHGRKVRFVGP
jgi:hypothetical protein